MSMLRTSRGPTIALAFVALALVLVSAALAVVTSVTNQQQASTIAIQAGTIDTLAANNDALREQLLDAGETPIAPPADTVVGAQGLPGEPGPRGDSVVAVNCSAAGAWTVVYDSGKVQSVDGPCIGANGATGPEGAASTVPGPQGPAGADGSQGAPGTNGEPPSSWTFAWLGVDYVCTRSDPFDPSAPTYGCTPA